MIALTVACGACTPSEPPGATGGQSANTSASDNSVSATSQSAAPTTGAGAAANCAHLPPSGEPRDISLAKCLAEPLVTSAPAPQRASPEAVLYLDHSASMRGFLHPLGANPTSFGTIVDRILAGAPPVDTYAYGAKLLHLDLGGSLAAINSPGFYSDRNTLLEQALDVVRRDTGLARTHILIGDGRRGSPAISDAQFTAMRSVATAWIAHGGTFIVGASMAPFQTVPTDPSGCKQGPAAAEAGQVCPLYAFVFVAPGDVKQVSSAVADVFQHVFIWPVPVLPASALTIVQPPSTPTTNVNMKWVQLSSGAPIVRMRGVGAASTTPVIVKLTADQLSQQGKLAAAILDGQDVQIALGAKALSASAASAPWGQVSPSGGLVRVVKSQGTALPALAFVTHGSGSAPSIISVDLVPTGVPSWLHDFDAVDSGDVVRTYGLSHLFSGFQFSAKQHLRPIARYTFVAN